MKRIEWDWEEWTDEYAGRRVSLGCIELGAERTDGEFAGGMG